MKPSSLLVKYIGTPYQSDAINGAILFRQAERRCKTNQEREAVDYIHRIYKPELAGKMVRKVAIGTGRLSQ